MHAGEVGHPFGDGLNDGGDLQIGVDCCHHNKTEESCSSCQTQRLATEVNDCGSEGLSSINRIPTGEKGRGPSIVDETGSGFFLPPLDAGVTEPSVLFNTASDMPGGIKLAGDEIDDVKTDAFGPFLSTLLAESPPEGTDADLISRITFEGDEELQTAYKALCY